MRYSLLIISILAILTLGAGCAKPTALMPMPTAKATPRPPSNTPVELPPGKAAELTVYVGAGCPNCNILESRVRNGRLDKMLPIVFKEVYNDETNALEMMGRLHTCAIPAGTEGVPMLWNGSLCILGQERIMEYLGRQLALQKP